MSLSRNASTKACTPAPVMKLDSKFKLRNVLFSRSMSLKAWEEEGKDVSVEFSGVCKSHEKLINHSPQRLGRYSAWLPGWTSWRACSFPWIWRSPSAWESECSEKADKDTAIGPGIDQHIHTRTFLHTLMLLRLTSVKVLSLLFTLCRVSSTLVGLGGSSNTGFIFSPFTTSKTQTQV